MKIIALCDTCQHRHTIDFDPLQPTAGFSDWIARHPGPIHATRFTWPQRSQKAKRKRRHSWEKYLANADCKISYAASAAVTITLASLAASSTLLAGRESSAIDNGASNKYLDYLAAGFYKAAASLNQAGTIRTCVIGAIDDTPTWPDVFDGTDSVETVTDQGTYDSICRILSDIAGDNTASQTWYWGPVAVAGMFGGVLPDQFVFFVSQSIQTSTNVWSATESDHGIKVTGAFCTVI